MKKMRISHLFIDIGGVILTNGWDHHSRKKAAKHFGFSFLEAESRHKVIFDVYERGKVTLDEYLEVAVFYKKQSFTKAEYKSFIFSQSKPYQNMLELIPFLKKKYGLKVTVVSNEGREINAYRIKTFSLNTFVDVFVSSSFIGARKPDKEIFQVALDLSQATPKKVLYLENTETFTQIARKMGMHTILHKDYKSTIKSLATFGLEIG